MASGKQRRKAAKATREHRAGGRPAVHPDGDRRRRGGPSVDQAIKDKRTMQEFPGVLPPEPPSPTTAGGETAAEGD